VREAESKHAAATGRAATLDQAKAAFRLAYEQWLARAEQESDSEQVGPIFRPCCVCVRSRLLTCPKISTRAASPSLPRGVFRPPPQGDRGSTLVPMWSLRFTPSIDFSCLRNRMKPAWIDSRSPSAGAEQNAMLKPGDVDIINPQV
jgi:hypothetical protein